MDNTEEKSGKMVQYRKTEKSEEKMINPGVDFLRKLWKSKKNRSPLRLRVNFWFVDRLLWEECNYLIKKIFQ